MKPIDIINKPIEKTPLNIAAPDPLTLRPIEWTIITKDNAEQVFAKLEAAGNSVVLFGLSSDGYQQLSMTIAEMRTLIVTQRQLIIKYKEYYEPIEQTE